MKVRIVRGHKIAVLGLKSSAVRLQHVAGDLVQIESAEKEIVLIFLSENARFVADNTARRGWAHVRHDGHQVAGFLVVISYVVDLAINAAVNGVNESVASAWLVRVEEGAAENPFALGREGDRYRVVHPAGHHWLDAAAVRTGAEDVGRAGDERRSTRTRVSLLRERAFAPINPAVGPELRPLQIVGAAGQRFALKPFLTLVGDAITIGVGQFP